MAEDVFGVVGSVIAAVYHVESVVAEGRFSAVYRAHDGGLRAPVALKLLELPRLDPGEQAALLQLFRREAELSVRLATSLPAVVRPLRVDTFTSNDGRVVPYLALEWLDGVTLAALIAQRRRAQLPPIALRKLRRLLTPVARALERAHHFAGRDGPACVVHGSLEPAKLFITRVAGEEAVKILGLGLGKLKSAVSEVASRTSPHGNPPAFTPAYGAPEQWAPERYGRAGPWTDVWGLALCLVEAMLGRRVIEGEPAAIMATLLDVQRRPTPRSVGIEVSDTVEAVFSRALALAPEARQPDVGVFWDELSSALDSGEASSPERALEHSTDPRYFVPDLELTPVPVSRRPTGEQPTSRAPDAERSLLELDATSLPASLELELDLPSESLPQRSGSYPRFVSVPPSVSAPPPTSQRATQNASQPRSTRSSHPVRSSHPTPSPDVSAPFEASFVAKIEPRALHERSLAQRLRPALGLLGAAILLAVLDPIYAGATGKVLEIVGLRLSLLAGALLLLALGLAARELIREQ
jgi:serine/threonine-protein kinase